MMKKSTFGAVLAFFFAAAGALTAAALYLYHREKELDEYERLLFSDDYEDVLRRRGFHHLREYPLRPRRGEGVNDPQGFPRGGSLSATTTRLGTDLTASGFLAMPYCHGENTICVNCCFGL